MKKLLTIILIGFLFSNCSNVDDEVDCETYDPEFPSLYLKLVDSSGNNLIENGTLDPNNITLVRGESIRFNPASQFAVPDADIRIYDNTLLLSIPDEPNFEYVIQANETEIISLKYTAKKKTILCGLSYYIPTGVRRDNQLLELIQPFDDFPFLTEIVL